jgi:hypothetical protein
LVFLFPQKGKGDKGVEKKKNKKTKTGFDFFENFIVLASSKLK